MRIGFDAKRLFNNFTGLGNYSRFVVQALNDFHPEHQYTLYTPKIKTNTETQFFSSSFDVRVPEGLSKIASGFWRSVQLGNVAYKDGVQIFHGLSNELPSKKPAGLKTVVTIHDVIFKRFPDFYKPIDRWIYDLKFRSAVESADKIIAVSSQTANDAIDFLKADKSKISVVYQGCHPVFKKSYEPEQVALVKKKYKLPEQFILNVGTIEPRKNALLLLQALHQLREKIPVVIVGRSTSYQAVLDEYVREKKLDNVTFIHDASFADLPLIYRAASLFVYPSFFEGFGIPIVEALSSGVPVITSKGSCFAEAGGPDCWYINPSSPDELAQAIEDVFRDSQTTKSRLLRARQYIEKFEPRVIADELNTVYKELA